MRGIAAMIGGLALAAAAPLPDPAIAGWAFVTAPKPPPAGGWDAAIPRVLPGAAARFTAAQIHDMGRAVDWFPAAHGALPPAVAGTAGGPVAACGFCHLPGGEGRVENASLAGLPAVYIRAQVAAFAAGTRSAAVPGWAPSAYMQRVAHQVSAAQVAAAARYFAQRPFAGHVRVVEAADVPVTRPQSFVLARIAGGGTEPVGERIVETPDDLDAFEMRDPRVGYTAYVPPGSLARGAAVVARVGCAACHGAGMKLWGAGRSPTYIFRQLLAFRTGARHDPDAAPMTAVAAQLTTGDMVAVAAYWGSLKL